MLIRSTMAETTTSRTMDRGTLLAMRNVFSSTAALSTEWPSENARSNDCATSALNSVSTTAPATRSGNDVADDVAEYGRLSDSELPSSSSDDSLPLDEVDSASNSVLSQEVSPAPS